MHEATSEQYGSAAFLLALCLIPSAARTPANWIAVVETGKTYGLMPQVMSSSRPPTTGAFAAVIAVETTVPWPEPGINATTFGLGEQRLRVGQRSGGLGLVLHLDDLDGMAEDSARELIQSFHTSTAGAQPPSEAACAPLHSQVSPITIGDFPLEAVVLVAAALAVLVVEPLELLKLTQPVKPASRPATPAANTICLSHFRVTPRR